jgi:hypothetical protein
LQHSVDERVLCNTPGEFAERKSPGVGDPRGSVAGDGNVERSGSVIRVNTYGLMRIAASEYILAVVAEAGDPDITVGI